MQLVDTHCHIQEAAWGLVGGDNATRHLWRRDSAKTADSMITHAADAGVNKLVCVGTTAEDSQLAVAFVQNRPACWASVGLHPHEAKEGKVALSKVATLVAADGVGPAPQKIVAIGECGLDYFYNHSTKKEQQAALRHQIELALLYKLPLIFHVRQAFADFWPIFDDYPKLRGVLHSYTDTQEHLEQALSRGLFIGVNGIATFTKDPAQVAAYRAIPLASLLLETDAPFLTPVPYRGKVNEPAHVRTVAEFLAALRGEQLQEIAQATTQNAQTLLKL